MATSSFFFVCFVCIYIHVSCKKKKWISSKYASSFFSFFVPLVFSFLWIYVCKMRNRTFPSKYYFAALSRMNSLERRNTQAEETRIAPAAQARSNPVAKGMLWNFSSTPTCSIIIMACPIRDFAWETDWIRTHVGIVWNSRYIQSCTLFHKGMQRETYKYFFILHT